MSSKNIYSMSLVAKYLNSCFGLPYGQNTLIKKLKEKGYLINSQYHSEPKQQYLKYFPVKMVTKNDKEFLTTLVSGKGLKFLVSKVFKEEIEAKKTQLGDN